MADDETIPTEKPSVSPRAARPVVLFSEPHAVFELGGFNLPDLRPEGTEYSPKDADLVRTLCRKYRVRFFEST